MDAKTEDLVARVALFRGLNKKHIAQLARSTQRQQYAPGQVIVRQGDTGVGLYIIASGAVEVRRDRAEAGGEPVVLNTLGPGQFFGEMALLDDYPRSATVAAREQTECLTLTAWHFKAELDTHPEIAAAMLPELARRLRATLQQLDAQA
ncbi:MAG: cyclic nucleotide-binding domain-containing protein [Chloroflexota bacterium]|nr:cyclic nucleotide-binding domain-containing protein [Chloroflexota bacterium]